MAAQPRADSAHRPSAKVGKPLEVESSQRAKQPHADPPGYRLGLAQPMIAAGRAQLRICRDKARFQFADEGHIGGGAVFDGVEADAVRGSEGELAAGVRKQHASPIRGRRTEKAALEEANLRDVAVAEKSAAPGDRPC